MIAKNVVRDLEADLAICEAATPGKWKLWGMDVMAPKVAGVEEVFAVDDAAVVAKTYDPHRGLRTFNARFIAEARVGWPYAIRRAMEAEAKVDRLQNELQMLQDELNRRQGT